MMVELEDIFQASEDPKQLEDLYQQASKEKKLADFKLGIQACYESQPQNMLFAAWYYRLQAQGDTDSESRSINWKLAIPLGILNGLVFWLLSSESWLYLDEIPYLAILWSPIAGLFVLGFLALTAQKNFKRVILLAAGLLVVSAYVLLVAPGQRPRFQEHYQILAIIHLPILAWIAAGLYLLGRRSHADERFAFLIKSLEVFILAGIYGIAGGVFSAITVGIFQALSITLPDLVIRLIIVGGAGLIPVITVANVYNPMLGPGGQDFQHGLSRLIATMMRILLPMTLLVLVVYVIVIPFNFLEPFKNRDVLIVYNLMLFAIMGLLVSATPLNAQDLSPKLARALRVGILAVAILASLVSIYALSATVYRTIQGGITINRLTIIGWNAVNISILVHLVYSQLRLRTVEWSEALKSTFRFGTAGYTVWVIFVLLAIPLLFR